MNPLILYMIKAGLCLAMLYFVYRLFLDRDTMYERNRFFILLSFLASFIFPLIIIETRQPLDLQFFGKDLSGVVIGTGDVKGHIPGIIAFFTSAPLLIKVYIAGVIIFTLKFLAEILSLIFLITRRRNGTDNIIQVKNPFSAGFSAFGFIFIDSALPHDEAREIIKHEQKHLDNLHFFDILFLEILKIIQWFNPFIYLFDRSLREVHEFQADEECLISGIPVEHYRGLMLNQVFRTSVFNASNSFSNPTLIKKRMIMMTRKRTRNLANLKMLLVLPVAGLLLLIFSTCTEKMQMSETQPGKIIPPSTAQTPFGGADNEKLARDAMTNGDPNVYVVVEEMPMFPGGDAELLKYIAGNTNYPAEARDKGIQGRVIVRFAIMADGSVSKATVLKSVDASLDAEALRVVSSLPAFKPGMQGGKPVPVWYMVPITFALGESKGENSLTPPPPPPPVTGSDAKGITDQPDQMPQFAGGDAGLLKYIGENTRYPATAKANKIMGRVITKFLINKDGTVSDVSVFKTVDPELDAEAIRVIQSLPAFEKPGLKNGQPVAVWFMLPITFSLK